MQRDDIDPTTSARFDPSQLDRHIEWLRRLAKGLVRDASLAEDIVQETALAAIKAPPALCDGSPRPWLARVLRNRAAHAARAASGFEAAKSVARQDAVAEGPRESDDAQQRLLNVETGRTLAELVLKLREPTRSTVLMRFWDDLPPRKIAKRQGIPLSTVKSRLARGLDQIRSELDSRNGGDRNAWLLAVLPMAQKSSGAALITLGGIGVQAKTITIAGAATLLGGTLYLVGPSKEVKPVPQDAPTTLAMTEPAEGRRSNAPEPNLLQDDNDRMALATNAPSGTAPLAIEASAPTRFSVDGTVLGADGSPAAGVPIEASGRDAAAAPLVATSDTNGYFSLETQAATGQLVTARAASDWVTVRPGTFKKDASEKSLVIAARAIKLAGVVVDEWGAVEGGVDLVLDLPSDFVNRFDASHAKSMRRDWRASTDASGHFVMENVPSVAGATLEATKPNGDLVRIEAPTESRDDLRLEFRATPIPDRYRLSGRVLYPDGIGAAGAYVAMGFETIRADEDGRFTLDLRATGAATAVSACAAGFQPSELVKDGEGEDGREGWPTPLEIRLRAPSISIEGKVVDINGEPQADTRIWIHEPTDFGVLGAFPLMAEGIAGGFVDPAGAGRSRGRLAAAQEPVDENSATGAKSPSSMLPFVTTDERGRFEVAGLLDRSYVLNVAGANLSFGLQTDPIQAGDHDVVIERPEGTAFPEIRGQVVTRHGQPLPNVNITPWVAALSKDQNVRGGRSSITRFFYAKGVKTDAEGRFTLKSVPKRHIEFWIAGDGVTPLSKSIWEVRDPTNFLIEMAARIEVSVEILDPTSGIDRVTAQGFKGEAMELSRIYADGSSNQDSIAIENGRTGVFALTTDAATITLMRGDVAVEVIDLDGDTEVVQRVIY